MADLFDKLTGEGPEERPVAGHQKWVREKAWPQNQRESGNRAARSRNERDVPSRAQRNVRPQEVSERVWGMAEQWLEMGEGHFGKRPPVNKQEFSKRLAAKINGDKVLRSWLRQRPEFWAKFGGTWEDGTEFVNDVLAKMIELFYKYLTEEQKNSSALQFAFLEEEWDEWRYQAVDAVKIAWLKANAEWVKYDLPKAVFDPATVGVPEDNEPCTDPLYEGMTWGEVRAQNDQDIANLPALTDEDYARMVEHEKEDLAQRKARIARVKDVMLANRSKTTTKEHTTDE